MALWFCPASAGIDLVTDPGEPPKEIDLDVDEYVPPSGTQNRLTEDELATIVRACDLQAAHPGNTENPEGIEGVVYTDMDGAKALPACLKAVEFDPDNLRLRYQLARSKQASGQGRDAITDLTELADEGYVPAMNNLGATYQIGIGVEKDYEKAIEWYRLSAGKGFVPSMSIIGWMYHRGLGTERDDIKAMEWYRKAAEGGSASAMHNIGFTYHHGWGVEKDPVEAAKWFRRAAEAGFGQAMSMTAWTYQVGRGVPVDGKRAIEWYEKAAEIGELSAMDALGGFYDTGGSGIARQPGKAADWLMKSLKSGNGTTHTRLMENSGKLNRETRRAIQLRLKDLGFDPGPADGVFGRQTRNAIDGVFQTR